MYCKIELFDNKVGSITRISQAVGSDGLFLLHSFLDLTLFARVEIIKHLHLYPYIIEKLGAAPKKYSVFSNLPNDTVWKLSSNV